MLIDIWFLLEAYWKWLLFNKWPPYIHSTYVL